MAAGAVAEAVADELELAAVATRRIDAKAIGSVSIGIGIGIALGFYVGYRYNKKKLRAEIYAEAEQEIASMREFYQQKVIAADHQLDHRSVREIVEEKGYVTRDEADIKEEADVRPLRPPVPVDPPRPVSSTRRETTSNVFQTADTEKDKDENWNYEVELADRTKDIYIIHQDEFSANESGYAQVSYDYYSGDNVLVDEADPNNVLTNKEELIGTDALKLFGHGADDYNLVHVRNDELELEFAIHYIPKSWEVEVLGLDANEPR